MKKLFNKVSLLITALVVAISAALPSTAMAAVPTAASDAITALQTDGVAMQALFWPVIVAITGGFILMKIFRKGANRAT